MTRFLIGGLWEAWDLLRSQLVSLARPNPTKSVFECRKSDEKKFAIFCLFDNKPRPDLCSLFRNLADAGFRIVGVAPNGALDQYEGLLDIVVRVSPVGRDFFAYQQGWLALDALGLKEEAESVSFFNDSVWYFIPHQQAMIAELRANLAEGHLVSGTMIFDEVPHCSGWLFGAACNERTTLELDQLFARNFARKSRAYNIRKGEHQVLTLLRSVTGFHSLDRAHVALPYSYCYQALNKGEQCFYMKADSTIRTRPSSAKMLEFLKTNCADHEILPALRWVSMAADGIYRNRFRVAELQRYRDHYFKS